jgi:hypothetical protein
MNPNHFWSPLVGWVAAPGRINATWFATRLLSEFTRTWHQKLGQQKRLRAALPCTVWCCWVLGSLWCAGPAPCQNVVEGGGGGATLPPLQLTGPQVAEFLTKVPDFTGTAEGAEAERLAGKLDRHVVPFLEGQPWQAFHHTLGISGYESYFAHPDEEFLALTLALPHLNPATAARVRTYLKTQLGAIPPYATDGFERKAGRVREHYDVPDPLRMQGRGAARSALGVYSFWLYCQLTPDPYAAGTHWTKVRARMQPLLAAEYDFDPTKRDYANDEAEKLNGDLAGLLGLWRLARHNHDPATETAARLRAAQLLERRVNLERVNPIFVEKTRTANRTLHVSKLARYCSLVPEVAEAVRLHSGGLPAARLAEFRSARNAWWLAFGDRFIGGENYTNPAILEQLPPGQLAGFVDVPWCQGDFYFIVKCAMAQWAAAGRPWKKLP